MTIQTVQLVGVFTAAFLPGVALAQHAAQQAGAPQSSAEMLQCARIQPVVDNIIAAAMTRLESARQSNTPAEMRAAVDQLEAALRDIRAQLAPCAAAAAAADAHAGMTMPGKQTPPSAAAPAQQPAPGVADPHAGHAIPAAPAAPKSLPASQTAPSKPATPSTADPHAGHPPSGTSPAMKSEPSTKKAPSKGTTTSPDAGHSSEQQAEKQMDPVNGLMVDPSTAPKTAYQGQTYYFSSEQSRKEFLENPAKFARKPKG